MKAHDKIKEALRLTDARMRDWMDTLNFEVDRIKPSENRSCALREVKDLIHTYFLADMGARFKDNLPLSSEELYDLVDELFEERGYKGAAPRPKLRS